MRIRSIIIILTISFNSCSPTNYRQTLKDRLVGQWKCENCQPHFIHAFINVPPEYTLKITQQHRIKTNFTIDLKPDRSFVFHNENGPTETGKYNITDSSLTLSLITDKLSWLNFRIDSMVNNKLFLHSETILFYSTTADSVDIFTGDEVSLIMKKK